MPAAALPLATPLASARREGAATVSTTSLPDKSTWLISAKEYVSGPSTSTLGRRALCGGNAEPLLTPLPLCLCASLPSPEEIKLAAAAADLTLAEEARTRKEKVLAEQADRLAAETRRRQVLDEELGRREQQLKEDVKAKILAQAAYMEYNDDFDEEDLYLTAAEKQRRRQAVDAKEGRSKSEKKENSKSKGREREKDGMDQ